MNFFTGMVLNTPIVHGRCVLTVHTAKPGYVSANDVREIAKSGAITILSESGEGSLSNDYGRTTFVFTKN